jgi:type III secretory pathway component EscR
MRQRIGVASREDMFKATCEKCKAFFLKSKKFVKPNASKKRKKEEKRRLSVNTHLPSFTASHLRSRFARKRMQFTQRSVTRKGEM